MSASNASMTAAARSTVIELPQPTSHTLVTLSDSWEGAAAPSGPNDGASKSITRQINALMQNYFSVTSIVGFSGETLAQLQARFVDEVLSKSPSYFMLIAGINSIAQDVSATDMFASTKHMIDTAVASGITPIILPCQATEGGFNNLSPSASVLQQRIDNWSIYNRLLHEYSLTKSGMIYIGNAYRDIIDHELIVNTVSTPAILPKYKFDIGHVEQAGSFVIAKAVKAQLDSILQVTDALPWHDNDKRAGCHNCMQKATGTQHPAGVLGTSTGSVSGLPAEGWMARMRNELAAASCALSQVARTDISGAFWTRATCATMDSAAEIELRESNGSAFSYNYHLLADYEIVTGDVIEFFAEIRLSSVSGTAIAEGEVNSIKMDVQVVNSSNASVNNFTANQNTGSTSSPYVGNDFSANDIIIISTGRYTVPATAEKWYVLLDCAVKSGASGTSDFTFDIGRVGIRKVS